MSVPHSRLILATADRSDRRAWAGPHVRAPLPVAPSPSPWRWYATLAIALAASSAAGYMLATLATGVV